MTDLGRALRTAREAAGLSLAAVAGKANYDRTYLHMLETGRRRVQAKHVAAYEEALGVKINPSPGRVTSTDVDMLSQATDVLTSLGLRHGGITVSEMAVAQWKLAEGLLGQQMSDRVRVEFSGQASRLADRTAWSLLEVGKTDHAKRLFNTALDLAGDNPDLRAYALAEIADHVCTPTEALKVLEKAPSAATVLEFSINGIHAKAYAKLGDWESCNRYVGLADEAWSRIDLDDLPDTNRPFASGHAGHADKDAGKAFYTLAVQGHKKAVPVATQRLQRAISMFGPERARALTRCQEKLDALS